MELEALARLVHMFPRVRCLYCEALLHSEVLGTKYHLTNCRKNLDMNSGLGCGRNFDPKGGSLV
jgi:hypothetical protein